MAKVLSIARLFKIEIALFVLAYLIYMAILIWNIEELWPLFLFEVAILACSLARTSYNLLSDRHG